MVPLQKITRATFKFQAVLFILILGASAVIFFRNYGEEERLALASSSFTEMYNDRLIAEHLIYDLTDLVHMKQLHCLGQKTGKGGLDQHELSRQVQVVLLKLEATRLSASEEMLVSKLKTQLKVFYIHEGSDNTHDCPPNVRLAYSNALLILNGLSDIQVAEGNRLNKRGQGAIATSLAGVKLQSALFMVLLLSLLVLAKNTTIKARLPRRHELN